MYQCTSWSCCERLCLASVIFFFRLFQHICPFHDGWFTSTPAHTALSVQQFLTKTFVWPSMTSVPPPSLFTWSSPEQLFFWFPWWQNVLKGERFASVEKMKQTNKKMAEALKGIKIKEFKHCFGQWKKVSIGVLHQMESTLKVTEV